jgi:hypothetical protein
MRSVSEVGLRGLEVGVCSGFGGRVCRRGGRA